MIAAPEPQVAEIPEPVVEQTKPAVEPVAEPEVQPEALVVTNGHAEPKESPEIPIAKAPVEANETEVKTVEKPAEIVKPAEVVEPAKTVDVVESLPAKVEEVSQSEAPVEAEIIEKPAVVSQATSQSDQLNQENKTAAAPVEIAAEKAPEQVAEAKSEPDPAEVLNEPLNDPKAPEPVPAVAESAPVEIPETPATPKHPTIEAPPEDPSESLPATQPVSVSRHTPVEALVEIALAQIAIAQNALQRAVTPVNVPVGLSASMPSAHYETLAKEILQKIGGAEVRCD